MKSCMGTTRYVLLVGKFAIKIPRMCSWRTFLYGILSNIQERTFWNQLKSPLLARVYYADIFGFMLIMERADNVYLGYDHPVKSPTKEEEKELKTFFKKCRSEKLPVDGYFGNVGKFNGKKKLIDYGA